MKTSVLIIAHNEERHIGECVESVLGQTQKPNEIVLIAHNCSDRTVEIAQRYPITVIRFEGEPGVVAARIKGMQSVTDDIVLCIDGDAYAAPNWVAAMSETLQQNGNVLVGSRVRFIGTLFWEMLSGWSQGFWGFSYGGTAAEIWGPSFGLWRKDTELAVWIWRESVGLSRSLGIDRNPEDHWLAEAMARHGNLGLTARTSVTVHMKESTSWKSLVRHLQNVRNGMKIRSFLKEKAGRLLVSKTKRTGIGI